MACQYQPDPNPPAPAQDDLDAYLNDLGADNALPWQRDVRICRYCGEVLSGVFCGRGLDQDEDEDT